MIDFLKTITIVQWIIIIIVILYVIGLINAITYTKYIYRKEMEALKEERKRKIAGVTAQNFRNNLPRYSPQIAKGNIIGVEKEYDEKIDMRTRKYKHDQINNMTSVFKNIFSIFR